VIAALTLAFLAPAQTAQAAAGYGVDDDAALLDYADTILSLLNQRRAEAGMGQLSLHTELIAAAQRHSDDMAAHSWFSHTGTDGSDPFQRMREAGYSYTTAAENIYMGTTGYYGPEDAFNGWWNSPGHHDNMMNPAFVHVGLAGLEPAAGATVRPDEIGEGCCHRGTPVIGQACALVYCVRRDLRTPSGTATRLSADPRDRHQSS
jgi:uncharacterized protein YkwD